VKIPPWTILTVALLMPQIAWAQSEQQHIITITGHGEAHAQPDTAMLSAGVSADAPTAAAALAAGNRDMQAVLATLKKMGVPDRNIQTQNFSVNPQYATQAGQGMHVTGYQVSNQVEVRLEDVTKLGGMLDALVTAGTNRINGIRFSIHDAAALLIEARGKAVADARNKADTFAKAAGVTLGSILSIRETGNETPRPVFAAPMLVRSGDVPIALGTDSIGADVTITWEIK